MRNDLSSEPRFVSIAETSRHTAPTDDSSWQESFFLGWCDIASRSGGAHHISLNPKLGLAHMWSWLVVGGKVVARCAEHRLPIPGDDLRNFRLAGHHFRAGESIRDLALDTVFETAELSLRYFGFHDPVELNVLRPQGRHYESMGRVRGHAVVDDRRIELSGSGWQDHSWGPRSYAHTLSERWLFAIFGNDLAFSVYCLRTSDGPREFGYVLDRGEILLIDNVAIRAGVAEDGLSPVDCNLEARTADGRIYMLDGRVTATAMTGGPGWAGTGGYFGMNGLTRFQHGGRVGEGVFELAELKSLQEPFRTELRFPAGED